MTSDNFQDIWIYINRQGKLIEVPAFIKKYKPIKLSFAISAFDRDNNTFIQEIAKEPGMIFNSSVWFKKRDIKKAREIFINEYGERINQLYSDLKKAQDEMNWIIEEEEN